MLDVDGGVTIDNITIDGTEIDLSSGDLTLDVAGDIVLDANGGNVTFKDDGTSILDIANSSTDVEITVSTADKNLKFKGTDGSSAITALDIDMAAAGAATFNSDVVVGGLLKMPSNTASKILVADGSSFEEVAIGDLAEISSIANDDVFIAIDTSGGGLKKVSRSQVVSGLAASGAITDVVDDSTPQLGGNLDMNGNDIVTTSNASIDLAPNGTGTVVIRGNNNQGTLTLNCENNSHGQKIKAAPHSESASNTLTLPSTGGDARLVSTSSTATLTNKSFGDNVDIFEDANNADVTLRMGTSATEALKIEVLNGGSNKTAESVAFTSATASSTGDHGQFTFSVDEATAMLTIDDGGISIAASGAYEVNGTAILSDSSGTMTLSNVDALDATTESTIESAIDTLSNLTTTGALNSGSITSGFGNIDIGSSTFDTTGAVTSGALTAGGILKTDDTTDATSTTDGSLQTDGGLSVAKDAVIGDDLLMLSDSSVIKFGANSEVTLTHDHNAGLALKHTATADDKPIILTLQTGETDMAANDVIGAVRFQAPDEGTGTDAILTAAAIQAVSEGDFAADANATKLEFHTAVSEAASSKMTLSSAGNLTVAGDLTITGDDLFMNTNTAGHILVGDDTNYNPVAVSGDIGLASNGAMTIQAGAVEHGMLADDIISGQDEITSGFAAADELMYSDAGTIKRVGLDTLATKLFSVASAGTVAQASDHMLFLDGGATGDVIVESIDDFLSAIAGSGISVSSSQLTASSASSAADDITAGDAAVNITTSSGNITIDAAANNTDIIFKGTDATSDITMLTLDGSEAGNAAFNAAVTVGTDLTVTGGDITYGNGQNATASVAATAHNVAGKNLTLTAGPTTAGTTNNIAGGSLTLQGGQGKGSGAGGDIIFQVANAGSSGSSLNSFATALTISDDKIATFADDIIIKDGGTFGVASATDALTISSGGIVTFVDDILIKDGGTIGNASVADVLTLASTGIVTFKDDIIIKDGGTIGSTSDADAISISSGGVVAISATTANTDATDGALTVAGGASVAADLTVGDDLRLLTDSAILSLGAGSDATLTHDGTTGLTIAATPISIDSTGSLDLNSTTGDINLQDGGVNQIAFDLDGTAGEVIIKPMVDSDDLVIKQYDGTEVIRVEDDASLGLVGNKLNIANSSGDVIIKPLDDEKDIIFQQRDGTEVARIEDNATFNVVTSKLAINGTAVTATAAELNFMDGGSTIGTTAVVDGDGIIHNDGGTMKVTSAATFKTYFQSGLSSGLSAQQTLAFSLAT